MKILFRASICVSGDALPICIADKEEFKKKDYFANKVAQIAGWGGPNFRKLICFKY